MNISKNSVSIAGEFAVLSQLALRGFDANMTLGHTKGVDILVSNPESGKMCKLEVKTSYNNKPSSAKLFGKTMSWVMSEKHETLIDPNLFYCFVSIEKEANSFRFFIVASKEVAEYVKSQHLYWLNRDGGTHSEVNPTTMRAFRIGTDDGNYNIPTTLIKNSENRWNLLG